MLYSSIQVPYRANQHRFVLTGQIITCMACVIYPVIYSVALLRVCRQGEFSSHKIYTCHMKWLTSACWVFKCYKVHIHWGICSDIGGLLLIPLFYLFMIVDFNYTGMLGPKLPLLFALSILSCCPYCDIMCCILCVYKILMLLSEDIFVLISGPRHWFTLFFHSIY